MIYSKIESDDVIRRIGNVRLDCARFKGVSGAMESFAMLRVTDCMLSFSDQADLLFQLLEHWIKEKNGDQCPVFARIF